ncbi:MAG: hypothetical protein HOY71_41720, partial [Nonomuraea sp.]|nr:hypothetical protein [Nonomuraea sp.]
MGVGLGLVVDFTVSDGLCVGLGLGGWTVTMTGGRSLCDALGGCDLLVEESLGSVESPPTG